MIFKQVRLSENAPLQDVLIQEGKITKIAPSIQIGGEVIEGNGKWLLPGIIDLNVRLKNDTLNRKNLELLLNDAARGGVTTCVVMPDFSPRLDNDTLLELLNSKLNSDKLSLLLAAPLTTKEEDRLNNIATLIKNGASAIQGNSSVNANLVRRGMQYANMKDVPMMCNCYEPNLDDEGVMNEGDVSFSLGLPGISKIAEISEVAKMCEVALSYGAKTIFQSISTMRALDLALIAKKSGANIVSEVCIHHLCKNDECCDGFNTNAKIKPPLREESERQKLLQALKEGKIDTLTSAHSPRSILYKDVAFENASFGIHAICDLLSLAYTYLVKGGYIGMDKLQNLLCSNPADVLGLKNKGKVAVGMDADLVLFDDKASWTMEELGSIYEGETLLGKVCGTYTKGKKVI